MSAYSSRILKILSDLQASFADIGSFTTQSDFMRENATYGQAFVKVGHQLGTALLVSKELLLVVADFPEVQMRNIITAQHRLARDVDRLQKGLVIMAHRDPNGDERLRTWGRDVGLTVLPVDYSGGMPQRSALLGVLLKDLYSYDRFDLTGPVRSEYQFFGRPFFPDLARRLSQGTIHALFGMRKIGKTSLLNRVREELTERHSARCVLLDASDDSLSAMNAAELLHAIRLAFESVSSGSKLYTTVIAGSTDSSLTPAAEAQSMLTSIQSSDRPAVLLIDEVDYITPSSPVAPHWATEFNPFFRALRRVYQETSRAGPAFALVLSGVSSRWFTEESIGGIENAALALVPEGYLPPLERTESIDMVETLGGACGLILDRATCDLIAHVASDNPFWIRKAGSYINSCYATSDRPVRLELSDVVTLCAEFQEVEGHQLAYSSIRHLFRIFPDLGFSAISSIEGRSHDVRQEMMSYLGRYGIINEESDPSGPMMAEALRRWKAYDSQEVRKLALEFAEGPPKIEAGSNSSSGEEEWAKMLSEVSLLRNTLERNLRDLILIVVRSECASSDRTPIDVIRVALPVDRRTLAAAASATKLLRSLYWLDLLQIVRKNWRWFEKVFGDRTKFDMWGDIINDRPDAHAKELDGADLALQRRAIDWFEAGIARSGLL